jgi:hypothetical protein
MVYQWNVCRPCLKEAGSDRLTALNKIRNFLVAKTNSKNNNNLQNSTNNNGCFKDEEDCNAKKITTQT